MIRIYKALFDFLWTRSKWRFFLDYSGDYHSHSDDRREEAFLVEWYCRCSIMSFWMQRKRNEESLSIQYCPTNGMSFWGVKHRRISYEVRVWHEIPRMRSEWHWKGKGGKNKTGANYAPVFIGVLHRHNGFGMTEDFRGIPHTRSSTSARNDIACHSDDHREEESLATQYYRCSIMSFWTERQWSEDSLSIQYCPTSTMSFWDAERRRISYEVRVWHEIPHMRSEWH